MQFLPDNKSLTNAWQGYTIAILAVVVAFGLSYTLWKVIEQTPFIFFIGAVSVSAWRGGFKPGMLSAALSVAASDFFLIEPRYEFFTQPVNVLQFFIFAMVAFLISWLEERRHKTASDLYELKSELEIILNNVADGITAYDVKENWVFANEVAAKMSGYSSSSEMLKHSLADVRSKMRFLSNEGTPIGLNLLDEARWTPKAENRERTIQAFFDGSTSPRWLNLRSTPVYDEDGELRFLVNIFRDVTADKEKQDIQALLSAIVENSDDAIISKDLDGIILSWNKGAEKMYGYTAEETVGHHITLLLPPELIEERETKIIPRLRQGERIDHYDTIRRHKNGERIFISQTISPMTDNDGKIIAYSTIERDITYRKKTEADLVRLATQVNTQRLRLENIIRNVPGMILEGAGIPDSRFEVTYVSRYSENLLGYTPEEWTGTIKLWEKIVHPDDWELVVKEANNRYQSGEPGTIQFRCVARDGSIVPVEAYMSIVSENDKEHRITSYGVIMDITTRKRIEAALTQYAETLKRSNDDLEQFAYIASHDLQEPLRTISSYLQLIEQRYVDKLDQDGKDFIEFAVDGSNRMKTLIQDLLAYSRVQRNQGVYEKAPLQNIINQVLSSLTVTIEDNQASITHDELPELFVNRGQMIQVFQNLIANAIKFKGNEPPQIHIGVERRKDHFLISVRDNGIGIKPEYLERIFAVFQRLHSKRKYPGTGIGLAICKKVIENHGGHIWAESVVGEGTTFFFTLPLGRTGNLVQYKNN